MTDDFEKLLENNILEFAEELAAARAKVAGVSLGDDWGIRNPESDPKRGFSPELIRQLAGRSERSHPQERRCMRYAVVIESTGNRFWAYVPDLPGCVATGATVAEVETAIGEAISLHLEGLREEGMSVPQPSSQVEYVEVAAVPKVGMA